MQLGFQLLDLRIQLHLVAEACFFLDSRRVLGDPDLQRVTLGQSLATAGLPVGG